jgi:hypothetical protein
VGLFIVGDQESYYNVTTAPNYLPRQWSTQSRGNSRLLHYILAFWRSYEMLPGVGVHVTTFARLQPRGLRLLAPNYAPVRVLLRLLGAHAQMPSLPEFTYKTVADATSIYPKVSQVESPIHRACHQYHSCDAEGSSPIVASRRRGSTLMS